MKPTRKGFMGKPATPAHHLKTPYIALILIAAIVVPLTASGFVWAKKGVTVVIDGETAYYKTGADTVADVLDEARIELGEHDVPPGIEVVRRVAEHCVRAPLGPPLLLVVRSHLGVHDANDVRDVLLAGIEASRHPARIPALARMRAQQQQRLELRHRVDIP